MKNNMILFKVDRVIAFAHDYGFYFAYPDIN